VSRYLSNWVDGYLELTKKSAASENFLKWSAISTVAAALQRKVWLRRGYYKTFPNLYILLVAEPAIGKGIAMSHARELLDKNEIVLCPGTTSKSALIDAFTSAMDISEDSITGETLTHSSLTLFSPEVGTFFLNGDPGLILALTDIFDGGMASGGSLYDKTIAHGDRVIENIFFNMIGGITPKTLQDLLLKGVIEGGLSSRIIYVYTARGRKEEAFPEITPEMMQIKELLDKDLSSIYQLRGEFSLGDDYKEVYEQWHDHFIQPENFPVKDPAFAAYCKRRVTLHAPKLAMIMSAASTDSKIIGAEDHFKAVEALEEVESTLQYIFSGMGELGVKGAILHDIKEQLKLHKRVYYSALLGMYQYRLEEDSLWNLIRTITNLGLCELKPIIRNANEVKYFARKIGIKGDKPELDPRLREYFIENNYKNRREVQDWKLVFVEREE